MEPEVAVTTEDALDVLELGKSGMLCAMDITGDSRLQWDKNNAAEVAKARAEFDRLILNHTAYMVNAQGQEEVITKFDPNAERIIMHKIMVGG